MAEKPLKSRDLIKCLRHFGVYVESERGKGSEIMLARVMEGRIIRLPTRHHGGGDEKPKAVIRSIRRHFKLTTKDGVTDKDFYSHC
jgi:hypothetical protein